MKRHSLLIETVYVFVSSFSGGFKGFFYYCCFSFIKNTINLINSQVQVDRKAMVRFWMYIERGF